MNHTPTEHTDLAHRLASAAIGAIRKTHEQTGAIPTKTRTASLRVRFADGRTANYTVTLKHVGGAK